MSDAEILGPNDPGPQNAKDANYRSGPNAGGTEQRQESRVPWERIIFTLIFAGVAWITFWIALVLALISAVVRLSGANWGANLADYAAKATNYLNACLSYVAGVTDVKPFPFGD